MLYHFLNASLDLSVSLSNQGVELIGQMPFLVDNGLLEGLDFAPKRIFKVADDSRAVELLDHLGKIASHLGQQISLPIVEAFLHFKHR